MVTTVNSIGLQGLEGYMVQVEVHMVAGGNGISVVGLPDGAVKESRERVLSALDSFGCDVYDQKITINLSPNEIKKNSPFFDLAMVVAILKEKKHCKFEIPKKAAFLGAVSLDGSLRDVQGLTAAIAAARKFSCSPIFVPEETDLRFFQGEDVVPVCSVGEVVEVLQGQRKLPVVAPPPLEVLEPSYYHRDFAHVIGHEKAKRAMEIAAAGGHHILLIGAPGCGKSMLAETFPTILPQLTPDQQLEVANVYQAAKMTPESLHYPPFRAPHHSASYVSLIGGGTYPKPGEVTLAHHGVLLLDETAEFTKKTLETLRQPLEMSKVTISRAQGTVTYPADFILVGTSNPCPCGYYGNNKGYCICSEKQIRAYQQRLSGPLLDRFDLILQVAPVSFGQVEEKTKKDTSSTIRHRVEKARTNQRKRGCLNVKATINDMFLEGKMPQELKNYLQQQAQTHHFSMRTQTKILRLAKTIADLKGNESITLTELKEAVEWKTGGGWGG